MPAPYLHEYMRNPMHATQTPTMYSRQHNSSTRCGNHLSHATMNNADNTAVVTACTVTKVGANAPRACMTYHPPTVASRPATMITSNTLA